MSVNQGEMTVITAALSGQDNLASDSKKNSTSEEKNKRRGGTKRKRKTEKQLACLQNELRGGNLLWSRQKIMDISERSGMSETQIYKWWWDQTRKRMKKLKKATGTKLLLPDGIDEFGRLSGLKPSTDDLKRRRNSSGNPYEDPDKNESIIIEAEKDSKEITNKMHQEMRDQISDLQEIITIHKQLSCSSDLQSKTMLELKRQKTSDLIASG